MELGQAYGALRKQGALIGTLLPSQVNKFSFRSTRKNRASNAGSLFGRADEMLNLPDLEKTCPILYLVNSPSASPRLMKEMADGLGVQHAFQDVSDLYTYDGSHLDRPNSEKWAAEFVKALDPVIDYCLAGNTKKDPKKVDISKGIISGSSNFETWQSVGNAEVTNKASLAPDGTQNADALSFPKAGAKLRKIYKSQEIEKGASVTFGIWLWADNYTTARLQIIRSCSAKTPLETTNTNITITPKPQRFVVNHTFENSHECTLVQIVGLKDGSKLFAWQGDFKLSPPPQTITT